MAIWRSGTGQEIKMHEVCFCRSVGGCRAFVVQMIVYTRHTQPLVKVCVSDVGGSPCSLPQTSTLQLDDCNKDQLQHLYVSALSVSSSYPCAPLPLALLRIDGLHISLGFLMPGISWIMCPLMPVFWHPTPCTVSRYKVVPPVFLPTNCMADTHWGTDQELLW